MTEDQQPIEQGVQRHSAKRHQQSDRGSVERGQKRSEHHQQEAGKQRPHEDHHEPAGVGGQHGILAREKQQPLGIAEHQPANQAVGGDQPQAHPEASPGLTNRFDLSAKRSRN